MPPSTHATAIRWRLVSFQFSNQLSDDPTRARIDDRDLRDGSKVTVSFRKPQLRTDGVLPKGGIAQFYGTATIHEAGPVYEEVWKRLVQPEKDATREEGLRRSRHGRTGGRAGRRTAQGLGGEEPCPPYARSVSCVEQCQRDAARNSVTKQRALIGVRETVPFALLAFLQETVPRERGIGRKFRQFQSDGLSSPPKCPSRPSYRRRPQEPGSLAISAAIRRGLEIER